MSKNENGFSRTYGVELLFDSEPVIDTKGALEELEKVLGRIDYHQEGEGVGMLFLLDHKITYDEGEAPSQLALLHADSGKDPDTLEEVVQQSWQTPNASEIVKKTKYKVLLTDLMASGLEVKDRLLILSNALNILVKYSNCIGIANKNSQQIISSERIKNSDDLLLSFINIRFFNAGDQGLIMDSLGLASLGLYDIQCHFVDLNPVEVSSLLYNTAYYIFNEEPVFKNGHTIEGLNEERWFVQFETSLVEPSRNILDINPSAKYSAGTR